MQRSTESHSCINPKSDRMEVEYWRDGMRVDKHESTMSVGLQRLQVNLSRYQFPIKADSIILPHEGYYVQYADSRHKVRIWVG